MEKKIISKFSAAISLKILGIILISFLLGFATHGFVQNLFGKEIINFSTIGLIGFVLSIVLAGSSIVLSIAAIMLGKFSEQAMIQRSDESIRLQNEVFQKTTDALQRIESSTGVTEKRIEDIISGRVGDLSHKLAEIATQEGGQKKSFSDIEAEIRNSLLKSFEDEAAISRKSQREERRKKEEEERRKAELLESEYQRRHQIVLSSFANRNDLKVIKTGHGGPNKSGEELFDGLYRMNDNSLIAVSTFRDSSTVELIIEFVRRSLLEISNNKVKCVFVFQFYENIEIVNAFNDYIKLIDSNIRDKIKLVNIKEDELNSYIEKLTF